MYQNQYSLQKVLIQVVPPKPIINKTPEPTSWFDAQYTVISLVGLVTRTVTCFILTCSQLGSYLLGWQFHKILRFLNNILHYIQSITKIKKPFVPNRN